MTLSRAPVSEGYPLCLACQRLRVNTAGGLACTAFPDEIPAAILEGRVEHRTSYPGDQGIRFEPDWGAPAEVLSLIWPAG